MRFLLLLLASLFLVGAAPAPAARDWRTNVVESAEGWTFGKPGAPLLAEYASFGCPHCRQFAEGAGPRIEQLVKAGRLRLAFRPFLIFSHDRSATVLARCVPSRRRLAFIKAAFVAQADTRARMAAADADERVRGDLFTAELAGPIAHSRLVADVSGLDALAEAHGLSPAARERCLADEAHQSWATAADLAARVAGVTGTPTYFLDGHQIAKPLTPEELVSKLPR